MSTGRPLRAEDYLHAIAKICHAGATRASTGAVAFEIKVANGTASAMLQQLAAEQLVEYQPYEGVRLTPAGLLRVRQLVRRRDLIKEFLDQTLGSPKTFSTADEAQQIELVVSNELVQAIDAFLTS